MWLREVQGGALDRRNLAGGDHLVVDRGVVVAVDLETVVQDVAARVSSQVEVGVLSNVDWCCLVRGGCDGGSELVLVLGQVVGHHNAQVARVALLPGGAVVRELHTREGIPTDRPRVKPALVQAQAPTMQGVWPIVGQQLVLLIPNLELGICDAVSTAPHHHTKVRDRLTLNVSFDVVIAQDHICLLALLVRYNHLYNCSSDGADHHLHALGVLQGEQRELLIPRCWLAGQE
mmetsp:Transcript_26051/g.56871  ORF Transcript_26051/g.56871 Transcript_26051/m.56871 type:complete len:232 (+) Transcript_26051:1052-1747(+)